MKKKLLLLILFVVILLCQQALGVTVVYPSDGSDGELLAAKEVRRYIYLRTDQLLPIQGVTSLPGGELILVCDEDDPLLSGLSLGDTTGPHGFIIKSINSGGRDILVITGNDSTATLHAAYRYAEHLGCGFDLAEDAIPDTTITLDITGLDEKGEPLFPTNGFLPFHDFFHGPDVWSTDDYKSFISQISKLGMNFIGLHTYTTYGFSENKDNNLKEGPEPHVWIGLPGDVNGDGTVSWSFPAYYRHTACPDRIWGTATWDTDQFGSGTSQLFDRNEWGSDVFGTTMPAPGNMSAWNEVHNRTGQMLKDAFGHAKTIGVKTCLGTELTMGLEPEGPEVEFDWSRAMPDTLQSRVSDPFDPDTVRDVYTAVFDRIMKTHDLDYYWLWSWEVWSMWGVSSAQIQAFKDDMSRAMEALSALGNPFQIAHAGWILGTSDNPAVFDNFFSPEVPFCGLWDEADSFEDLQASRVKWPATWMEEDWGLGQPQLEGSRVYADVKAAWNKNCDGMIAKHWRTKSLLANPVSLKDILWCYGPTGSPISKGVPSNQASWLDDVYLDWATRQFGPEAASSIANILSPIDNAGEGAIPGILEWETDDQSDHANSAPGAIAQNSASWSTFQNNFTFVDNLVAQRGNIVGAGNQARYEYLLDCMESYKLMAEYGCVRDDYMKALGNSNWSTALTHRRSMARLFEQFQTMFTERIVNATDLGAICHHEILNWRQLVELLTDAELSAGLGGSIPSDAYPTSSYLGSAFVKVVPALTQVNDGEALTLKVLIMDSPTSATLHYRPLGGGSYTDVALTNVARGVYEVTIPAQSDDFEYYIDAVTPIGNATFPVTAPTINQTVVVLGEGGPPDTTPPTPDPMTWASVPAADNASAISMTATTATDPSGVSYYFDETTGNPGGTDSGWQASESYTDSGLNASTQYCYEVKARDNSANQNETAASSNQCATTDAPDTTPPTPDPMTWAAVPAAVSSSQIEMTATTATDPSGVQYYFDETTGNPGGTDSGWQDPASYTDAGLNAETQYCYQVTARDKSVNQNETASSSNQCATTPAPPAFKLDFGKVTGVGSSWTNVTLSESYTSPVVVAVANYDNTSDPAVVRIQNASGSSFDVRVDAAGGTAPSGLDVHYMVVEEGVYTVATDGVKMEAVKYNSTVTDENNSWVGQPQTYSNSYTSPVVLGQVMTYADAGFSTFWCYDGSSKGNPPSATSISTGKSVAEDTDTTRENETVGYIVIEAGSGTMAGTDYVAALGADGVAGVTNSPPYTYSISGLSEASVGIASLSAMDGGNGGWALLYGSNPVTASAINIAIDEDVIGDTERSHTTEQVAYIVFEEVAGPDTTPPTPDPMTWATAPNATGENSIDMVATTASDPSGVQYYFDETTGGPGGTDSGWQSSASYTDSGLTAATQYCYEVTARDQSVNLNETAASSNQCATTDAPDTTPPTPDPATWAAVPSADSSSAISMTATTGSDPSGVQYSFDETSGNPGGSDSGWQSSASYTDSGLDAETQYCYRVQMRDQSPNQNTGSWSTTECATTEASGWTQIQYDDFEGGFGNWNDGGLDCKLYTGGTYAHQGSNALDLEDNTDTSVATTDNLALAAYAEVKVDFWYICISMDKSTEDFWLQISTNGGGSFDTVEEWNEGDEFENGEFYPDSVTITGYTLTNQTQIRFRCDASGGGDDVYIDEIAIFVSGEPVPDTDPPTPNPATWASVPAAGGSDNISMTATTGSDPSGVQYSFDETSGNPGGTDSGWQSSASYTDSGLTASTQYCYRVQMRDQSPNQNTGSWSTTECATTTAGGETWQKVDERDSSVAYAGDWDNNNWGPPCYMGTVKLSTQTGASATYSFTGTQVRLYVLRESTQTLDIYVDDEFQQQIVVSGSEAHFMAWESGVLSGGSHTLKVERAAGEAKIDAFEHYGP